MQYHGISHGHLYTGQLCCHFVFRQVDIMRGGILGTFFNLKNTGQDLSNEGSNFILSSLKVGYWVAQT